MGMSCMWASRSLKNRVSSYFVPSAELGPKKQPMLAKIDAIDTIECDGEWEALLMESRLIKDTRPPFNTRLVDDKTFPYLVVTMRDDFPGCSSLENPPMRTTGRESFGPFASAGALREAVQLLQRVFDTAPVIWTSKTVIPKPPLSALPLHSIGQCTAPCADRISKASYRRDVDAFVRFLGSKRSTMLRELREEMAQASADCALKMRPSCVTGSVRSRNWTIGRSGPKMACSGNRKSRCSAEIRLVLKSLLHFGLTLPIRSMEAIDIAHLQGGETVGSKVCSWTADRSKICTAGSRSARRQRRLRGHSGSGITSLSRCGGGRRAVPRSDSDRRWIGTIARRHGGFADLSVKPPW